jgi:uncharacterized protein GlcG (DUF336 family)
LAVELAKATVAGCTGSHIAVVILDQAGLPKLYYVTDGTVGFHAYTAYRKANSALEIKAPSEQLKARMDADSALAAKVDASTNYFSSAGGLPIVADGEVIGAIGVSGVDPPPRAEACAAAGLEAVKGRLRSR